MNIRMIKNKGFSTDFSKRKKNIFVPRIAVEIPDHNRKRQQQKLWNQEKVKGGSFSFSKNFCRIFVCSQRTDRDSNRDRNLGTNFALTWIWARSASF